MCGCTLGCLSVTYHFRVSVTLTSDLVFMPSTLKKLKGHITLSLAMCVCMYVGASVTN